MNHLNTIANMAAAAQQIHTHVHRAPVIKVELLLELNYVDKTLKEDQRKFPEEFFKNVSMLFQLMFLQEQYRLFFKVQIMEKWLPYLIISEDW